MGDVTFGYVYDFGTGEEWTAQRGGGACLDGRSLGEQGPKETIEILSFEGTTTRPSRSRGPRRGYRRPASSHGLARAFVVPPRGGSRRRCRLAEAGAFRRHRCGAAPRPQCGLAIELFEDPPFANAPLDLGTRSRLAAAGSPHLVRELAAALTAP